MNSIAESDKSDIHFIEITSRTNSGLITKQIPVINNRIISIDSGGGALMQLVARGNACYLTGNPEVSFFEHGSKYLWNDSFYKNHSNETYKIRSDDFPISNITNLTGEIQYNPVDVSAVYSPYYDQYNAPTSETPESETPETPETLCTQIEIPERNIFRRNLLRRRRRNGRKSTLTRQHRPIISGDLFSSFIEDARNNGKYQIVSNIYADLARERRRHAVVAMNICYFD